MAIVSVGELELEVLRLVSDHSSMTMSEVVEQFAVPRGLARTTIHTVLERLRKKGYLTRSKGEGSYRYAPTISSAEVMTGLVGQFVQRTLGGSVKPFVAYLTQSQDISKEEIQALQALVAQLGAMKEEETT